MLGIFLDQETTGLDSKKHVVLQIAFRIVSLNTGQIVDSFEAVVIPESAAWEARDAASMAVNGLTWGAIKDGESEEDVRKAIIEVFIKNEIVRGKAVFICQNPSFDRTFFSQLIDPQRQEKLQLPYHWLDLASMYWALRVKTIIETKTALPEKLVLSKDSIAQTLNLPPEQRPHRAMQGVDHLLLCYRHVVGFPG